MIRRREFITLLGGAAAAWPLTARAQQGERVRRIGVLMHLPESDPEAQARVRALLQGLQQLGWSEGRNVRIDYRFGAADIDRSRKYAAELIALAPDVIQASGTGPMAALQQTTRTVPIGIRGRSRPSWHRSRRQPCPPWRQCDRRVASNNRYRGQTPRTPSRDRSGSSSAGYHGQRQQYQCCVGDG